MLARALAAEARVPLLALTAAVLENKWWGESAKLLQAAFQLAKTELQPCIVFFDEVDGLGGRARSEHDQACVYSFKTELLRNLDALDGEAVMVLACTNCVHALDPALRRRLPTVVHVGKPDAAARRDILKRVLEDGQKESEGDATVREAVAEACHECTGADLAALAADASAQRLDALADIDDEDDGAGLLRRLGPLTWTHWRAAAARRGWTWPAAIGGGRPKATTTEATTTEESDEEPPEATTTRV